MMVKLAKQHNIKVIEVGSKGSSPIYPELQTEKYRKIFIERMADLGGVHPSFKTKVFMECLDEEAQWLKSIETMDHEYNEIVEAQQVMDELNGE